MRWFGRYPFGLVSQIVAILLLALAIEFGTSTLLYERASQFAVRDDEAHRLAEHLVISRKIVGDALPDKRPALVRELTTERYVIRWGRALPVPAPVDDAPIDPALAGMRRQMTFWEPTLADSGLRLSRLAPGQSAIVTGGLLLPDRSWLHFRTRQPVTNLDLSATRMALALIPALLLMALGGMLIRRALAPLRQLARAVDRFDGDENVVVAEAGPPEVRQVTRAFNDLQSRIRALVAERTQALAAVSHDLRTPLARLNLRADDVVDAQTRGAIQADVGEMNAMVSSLLAFLGGDDDPDPAMRVDIAVLLATIADAEQDAGRDVHYAGPDHAEMETRLVAFRRSVNNLVDNAVRYGRRVALTLAVADDGTTITVDDDGPGIPEHMLTKVLEPFVRLDDARTRDSAGFGLGLAIVTRSAALLGGTLTLTNRAGGGLRARLSFPAALHAG
ncbi:MAG: ATP-binding protein [Sphingomonas sp.]